jgi:hypothetical protein
MGNPYQQNKINKETHLNDNNSFAFESSVKKNAEKISEHLKAYNNRNKGHGHGACDSKLTCIDNRCCQRDGDDER